MSIETIVRAFAAPLVLATRRVPVFVQSAAEADAIISWGNAGTLIDPQEILPAGTSGDQVGFQIVNCSPPNEESGRKTKTQRVTNQDDSSQFIDVQVPTEITFKQKKQPKDILRGPLYTAVDYYFDHDPLFAAVSDALDVDDTAQTCQQRYVFSLVDGL